MKIPPNKEIPPGEAEVKSESGYRLWVYFKKLFSYLDDVYDDISNAVNYNDDHHTPKIVAQTSQPTPNKGELVLWQNTGATSGDPTHYIVWNHSGTILTFASQETVP